MAATQVLSAAPEAVSPTSAEGVLLSRQRAATRLSPARCPHSSPSLGTLHHHSVLPSMKGHTADGSEFVVCPRAPPPRAVVLFHQLCWELWRNRSSFREASVKTELSTDAVFGTTQQHKSSATSASDALCPAYNLAGSNFLAAAPTPSTSSGWPPSAEQFLTSERG